MFVVSVGHNVKPGRIDDAKQTMMSAGAAMAANEGFVFRFLVTDAEDPQSITSYTAWLSEEHMQRSLDAFKASGAKWPDPTDPTSPYRDVVRQHLRVEHFVLPDEAREGDGLRFALRAEQRADSEPEADG